MPSLVTLKIREGPLAALVSAWNHNEDLMDRQGVRAAPVPLAVVDGDHLVLGHLLPRPHLEHLPQLHRAHQLVRLKHHNISIRHLYARMSSF